jgi:L-methionine (R)-S-oxide reductase
MTTELAPITTTDKSELYEVVANQFESLISVERDFIANAANLSSMIYHSLPELNWAGLYVVQGRELVLGPFQGKPACVRIPIGTGVCGTAAAMRETVIVPNVHDFPGHIACDSESEAEIVVPLISNENLIGVLDLDSPRRSRFDEDDARGLNRLVEIFLKGSDVEQPR